MNNNIFMANTPSCTPTDITNFNTVIDKISQDKKIDGKDKAEIDALLKMYDVDKKDCIIGTKDKLKGFFEDTLKNGYTVTNKDDIVVLQKMLGIMGKKYNLVMQYEELYKYGNFSVKFSEEVLEVYKTENVVNDSRKRIGIIDQSGEFEREGIIRGMFRFKGSLDLTYDNNNIGDLNSLKQKVPVEDNCKVCYNGDKSTIDKTREIIKGTPVDDKYRLDISKKWMNTKLWKDLVQEYTKNKSSIPAGSEMMNEMDKILTGKFTFENVQNLQYCIKMLDSSGKSVDTKVSQDGMLGINTTKALSAWIKQTCNNDTVTKKK